MPKHDYAIQVHNVKKSFYLPHHKNDSLKTAITQAFKPKEKGGDTFNALNGVSFNVEKGDFFGILGRNGSGKSTLLKIISEIYQPSSGNVRHDGKLVSFIELGVGFKAELTGRENVFLNGALLGFSKQEVEEMYDEIVDFAELEQFMDQKLKNYSSGMKVRLAFSVAIRAKADILVLDEVLAVGDAAFQKKCTDYFRTLKDGGKTVILVTHGMAAVREFCNKAIVIEDGKVVFEGDADGAADEYMKLFDHDKNKPITKDEGYAEITAEANIQPELIDINLHIKPLQNIDDPIITIVISRNNAQVFRWVSDEDWPDKLELQKNTPFNATLRLQNIFPVGTHVVDVAVKSRDRSVTYGLRSHAAEFRIANTSEHKHRTLWRPEQTFIIDGAADE